MLLRDYAATIQASFSGHIHQDSYRLVMDAGAAVGVEKVTPSISPIFGNNPGFHLFDYDRQTGDVTDFSTWYLANLDQASATTPGEWRREYVFTEAYGKQAYSAAAIKQIADAMLEPESRRRGGSKHLPSALSGQSRGDRVRRAGSLCLCHRQSGSLNLHRLLLPKVTVDRVRSPRSIRSKLEDCGYVRPSTSRLRSVADSPESPIAV